MANKWAIQNGNWGDGSTWNDGVVPTADDDVYANGYTITIANDIIVRKLSNAPVEQSIVGGGYFLVTSNLIITANIENKYALNSNTYTVAVDRANITLTIIGDLVGTKVSSYIAVAVRSGNALVNTVLNVIGNCYDCAIASCLGFGTSAYSRNEEINITGNINTTLYSVIPSIYFCDGTINITIVGNIDYSSRYLIENGGGRGYQNIIIDGNIISRNVDGEIISQLLSNPHRLRVCIYGSYYSISGRYPFSNMNDIFFENGSVLQTKDSNGNLLYMVVGSVSSYKYPKESDVKKDVVYGMLDEFEGTFEVDYPQEANVLKGVEYDDGNKVGTLEVIALSGATATAENISVVNLTEQEVERVKNCATISTVQKCFEEFKE